MKTLSTHTIKRTRISLVLLLLTTSLGIAQDFASAHTPSSSKYVQQKPTSSKDLIVRLGCKSRSITEVFTQIEKATNLRFMYNSDIIRDVQPITISEQNYELSDLLNRISEQVPLQFKIIGSMISVAKKAPLSISATENTFLSEKKHAIAPPINGTIKDSKGEGAIGASIVIKGTTKGTVTDVNGNFSLDAKEGDILVISSVGFQTQEIVVGKNTSNLTIILVEDDKLLLDNIVVIGSRNASRTKIETPVPVDIIPVSNVVNEIGQVDINQILTYIAPSFQSARQSISDGTDHVDPAQLRGLGPDQVLVLVNGKRRHQSSLVNVNGTVNRGTVGTDMNAIPATSIDRIEILRDGAAAQYGSDAIAGVINIVLKKQTGLSANVSYGANMTSYEKNYAVKKLNSAYANAPDKVSVTDGNTTQVGLNYGVKLGEKGFLNVTGEYTSRERSNRTGTYTGQIWPSVNGVDKSDSINTAKGLDRNTFDMLIGNSQVKGGGIIYNLMAPINEHLEIYSFGGFNNKKGNAAGFYRYPSGIPAAIRSNVLAVYPNGFLPEINSNVTDISFVAGLRGKVGSWDMDLSQAVGQNSFDFGVDKSVNYTQVVGTPTGFQTKFNAGGTKFSQYTTNLDFSKKHEILAGLNTALGAEYRVDAFEITAGEESSYKNYNTASGVAAGSQVFQGFLPSNAAKNSRNNFALYTDNELDINKQFMISGALRFENYSDFGTTLNYKFATRYKISDAFTLRASTSTGFRAPSQQQKYYAKTNTLFVSGPSGLVPVESGTFTNDSKAAKILGIPELDAEKSTSYSFGFTTRPVQGLEITVDYYSIAIKNRIVLTNNFRASAFTGSDTLIRNELLAANATEANFFTNAVDTKSKGLEAVIAYSKKFANNSDIRFVLAGTFINNEVVKGSDGKPVINATEILKRNNQIGNYFNREDQSRMEVASPRNKISFSTNYKFDKFNVMLRMVRFGEAVYLDPTIDPTKPENFPANALNSNAKETLDQTFAAKVVTDLSIGYSFAKGATFTVGANNLFDVYQDKHTHANNISTGRFVYSRRVQQMGFNGRYVFARLAYKF